MLRSKMDIQNNVPYFSQHDPSISKEWQSRACGVVSVQMALNTILENKKILSTMELIEKGLEVSAYDPNFGWRHDGLVDLAKNYGAQAFRKEFKKEGELANGIIKLRQSIEKGSVPIVSITIPGIDDTHLVPLTGLNDEGFFYHEPAKKSENQEVENIFISNTDFENRWRRLAIFVERAGH